MKNLYCAVVITLLSMPALAAQRGLVAHWTFDEIRIERIKLDMERGEFQLSRELYGYVTNGVDGSEGDYNAKYLKQARGVSGGAVLLDGNTGYIRIDEDDMPRVKGDFSHLNVGDLCYHKSSCQAHVVEGYAEVSSISIHSNLPMFSHLQALCEAEVVPASRAGKLCVRPNR